MDKEAVIAYLSPRNYELYPVKNFRLIDRLENGFYCSCGKRLFPDCDASSNSIAQCFEYHLIEDHGMEIDAF